MKLESFKKNSIKFKYELIASAGIFLLKSAFAGYNNELYYIPSGDFFVEVVYKTPDYLVDLMTYSGTDQLKSYLEFISIESLRKIL